MKIYRVLASIFLVTAVSLISSISAQDLMVLRGDTTKLVTDSVYLSVGDYRGQIQWQASLDSNVWIDIDRATDDTLFVLVDSTVSYRAKIIENTCDPVYSDTIYIYQDRQTRFSPNVVYIDSVAWGEFFKPELSDSTTFTFTTLNSSLDSIAPGDILFSNTDDGYLKKVINVELDSTNNIIFETVQSNLSDLYESLYATTVDTLRPSEEFMVLPKGVKLTSGPLEPFNFDITMELYDADGRDETKLDKIMLNGTYKLNVVTSNTISIKRNKLKRLYFENNLTEEYNFTISIPTGISSDDRFAKKIFAKPLNLGTITIGALVIKPKLQIELGTEFAVYNPVTGGIKHSSTSKTATIYENGIFRKIEDEKKTTDPVLPNLEDTKAYAKVFVKPEISFMLYGFIGPYLDLEVFAELDIEPFTEPWWSMYRGVIIGGGVKMDIFNSADFDYHTDFFVYKDIIKHAEATNLKPVASCAISPLVGVPGTNFTFNALGCSDKEDETIDLTVRWDWDNDGIWDTYYSKIKVKNKVFSKIGEHIVRMEARDSDGATNIYNIKFNVFPDLTAPPVASFYIEGSDRTINSDIIFNAAATYDPDGALSQLRFAWDWENDGELDTEFSRYAKSKHQFKQPGTFEVRLVVLDITGEISTMSKSVEISYKSIEYGTVTDIDNNTYKTVTIGTQEWMAENLKTTKYADGTPIPYVTGDTNWGALRNNNIDKAYCWYNDIIANKEVYGALYTYAAATNGTPHNGTDHVQGVCPNGWHLPSNEEWKVLEIYLGMSQSEADNTGIRGTVEGVKLKATLVWNYNFSGTDEYGFSALPAGYRFNGISGMCGGATSNTSWWTSSLGLSNSVIIRKLLAGIDGVYRTDGNGRSYGLSVRCVKD